MMFEAYVTNLGMYPERGVEVGEYLKFPTTIEEVQALFSRIGIDGKRYEEYFITDYQSDVLGLYDHLGEYESLDELNFLAHLLEEMTPDELEKLEAVMDAGEYTGSVKDLINLTQNLDCFEFYPGVKDEEELGRIEIYLTVSLAPIPFSTMANREWGQMGTNYLRSLFALGFQGFLILVCVAIYAVLVQSIPSSGDIHGAIWGTAGYTVLLAFALFKTGSLSKSIFNSH